MNKQNKLTSEDRINFLLNAYFGDLSAPFHVAVDSAYLDLCRTIQFKMVRSVTDGRKAVLRSEAVKIIEESIDLLGKKDVIDQTVFDEWHTDLCRRIISVYKDSSVPFYFGQAQKWVNMSLK